ncbi:MAG TPA: adenylate/guanylate cyclase domain-containing protein [Actinomycetota bacterium]|nr:adenylate/guanylate cyclase domain-containing protein [Actinomycetota bacterium]
MTPSARVAEGDLASQAGTDVEMVRRLVRIGVLPEPEDGRHPASLVPRLRLALQLEATGISLEDLGRALREGAFSLAGADHLFARPARMLERSRREFVSDLSVSAGFVHDVEMALGLVGLADDEPIRQDDAEVLELLDRTVRLGIPEAALARFFQVNADAMRRVAQAGREMWETGVEAPLRAAGISPAELLDASAAPAEASQLLGDRVNQILFHRFLEEVIAQAWIQHLEAALEEAGVVRRRDPRPPAIAFLDLTGYTRLTEEAGDEAAAEHARGLVDIARRAATGHRGRLVKMLGDGAMFHFRDPTDAVRCGLELVEEIPRTGLPPARVGIDAGPLIIRDADFYGRTVNIAARLTDYARPREVLVSAEVVGAWSGADAGFREIGPVSLKGVPEPIVVYAAGP